MRDADADNNIFENILVKCTAAGYAASQYLGGTPNYFNKCVFWDSNDVALYGFTNGSTHTIYAKNCLVYGFNHGFDSRTEAINCVAINARTNCFNGTAGSASNNASTDGTAPGANSLTNQTLEQLAFKDYANGDFHVKFNSVLKGAGINLTSTFSQDFDLENIDGSDFPMGPDYLPPTCWTYTAKYKNSKRLYRVGGPDFYPKKLRVPSNVDTSTGRMIDEGELIDPSKYVINQG